MFEKHLIDELINFHHHSFTIINKNEEIIYFSKRAEEIFNMQSKEIKGLKISDVFHKDKLVILQSLRNKRIIEKKGHQATPEIFVDIKSVPLIINGQVEGAVVSEVDVTEEVRQKEEIKKLQTQVETLSTSVKKIHSEDPFKSIVYKSAQIEGVKNQIRQAAKTKANILITGETGVGKELFARAVHDLAFKDKPFIPINCGAIPSHLFESELFGYAKGAFTGANKQGNKGKIEAARGGTLLLDEIGEMPIDMQVKFLRVLQEKHYFKLGSTVEEAADFRLVSATNRKIADLLAGDDFRSDLLYRINVINIHIPPLRERPDDVESLFFYYLLQISQKYDIEMRYADRQLVNLLKEYHWPGNVRELINIVERLVIFSGGSHLDPDIFLKYLDEVDEARPHTYPNLDGDTALKGFIEQAESEYLSHMLDKFGSNIEQTAKALSISRPTLYSKIKKYNL
ncbi:sigma 54-interacting transcriptional regulator [Salinicoccus jeotgali]|uniref:Sigma 54-interacting transcriptional regulator n=1 Tax=Salinicoccus jeotgali TaxID=381634 RepID=A0ABP7F571_9STAP